MKCSLLYYDLIFWLIVFVGDVSFFGSVFDIAFVSDKMFDLSYFLLLIFVHHISSKTIDRSHGCIELLQF